LKNLNYFHTSSKNGTCNRYNYNLNIIYHIKTILNLLCGFDLTS
jgi:hypothetical protein